MFRRWRAGLASSWWGLILAEHDTEPTELAGGLLKVLVGGWLLLPQPTFSSSPAYLDLAVLPEGAWGTFLIAVGLGHLVALRDGHRVWRRWACLVGFVVWFAFGSTFLLTSTAGLGPVMFFAMAAGQGWAYIRLGAVPT